MWRHIAQFGVLGLFFGVIVPVSPTIGANVSSPEITGAPGTTVEVPVNVDDSTGIAGFQFTVTFDPSELQATDVRAGDLTSSWLIISNINVPGQIRAAGIDKLLRGLPEGSGSLLKLVFKIKNADKSPALIITESKLRDNQARAISSSPGGNEPTVKGDSGGDPTDYEALKQDLENGLSGCSGVALTIIALICLAAFLLSVPRFRSE